MTGSIVLSSVWEDDEFNAHQGVLDAHSTVAGEELGYGVIYYSGPQKVTHRIAARVASEHVVLGETGRWTRCLWNEGEITEIVNEADESIELLRIGLDFQAMRSQSTLAASAAHES